MFLGKTRSQEKIIEDLKITIEQNKGNNFILFTYLIVSVLCFCVYVSIKYQRTYVYNKYSKIVNTF